MESSTTDTDAESSDGARAGQAGAGAAAGARERRARGFDTRAVLTLAAAHTAHDIYTSFLAPILPLLIARLSIPLGAAGFLPSVYRTGSMAQPILGFLADRFGGRYFVILAPSVTAISMSLLGVAPNYLAVVLLLAMGGFGHAIFHPASASIVTRASGDLWGRGTSLYMTGGKIGFAIGPMFIVSVVTWLGEDKTYVAAVPGVLFSLLLFVQLRKQDIPAGTSSSTSVVWGTIVAQKRALLLLSGFVLFRALAHIGFSTFYPTYLVGRGSSLVFAGFSMTVFQLSGALGALMGGTVSDLMGRRAMLIVSQLLCGPFLFVALGSPDSLLGLVFLGLGGAMVASAAPVQLTLFQEMLPGSRSTAAGIWSILSFEGSLFTAVVIGLIADWFGLGTSLGFSVLASMLAIPFIMAVPEPRRAGN